MKLSWKIYIISGAVLILSFLGSLFLPLSEMFKGLLAIPGVGSLLGALYQLFKDQAKYENDQELQQKQHIFNLSVTSHMANVAFDKHVEFSERYIHKMDEGIRHLFENGPSGRAKSVAIDLMKIRRGFTPWITEELITELSELENNLIAVGIAYEEIENNNVNRNNAIELSSQAHKALDKLFGSVLDLNNLDSGTISAKIITKLQNILGIEELTELRKCYVNKAIGSLKKTTWFSQ